MNTLLIGKRSRKGMTGLETAIILIAFIIVASTFAFTILNLGFQTAQKSGQVVQNGMNQASSSIELDGAVIAYGNSSTANAKVSNITFVIQLSAGANPVDLSSGKLTVAYSSSDKYVANAYAANSSQGVEITELEGTPGSHLLGYGDTYQVRVFINGSSIADTLVAYNTFTVELKPTQGAVLTISRALPGDISDIMDLN